LIHAELPSLPLVRLKPSALLHMGNILCKADFCLTACEGVMVGGVCDQLDTRGATLGIINA